MRSFKAWLFCFAFLSMNCGGAYAAEGGVSCPPEMDCGAVFRGSLPSAATPVTYTQELDDDAASYFDVPGEPSILRRYLRYIPDGLPEGPVPLLVLFHGANVEAETIALFSTLREFEKLADENKFILIYANAFSKRSDKDWKYPGVWLACYARHAGESPDVSYVRQIVSQVARLHAIDMDRIYAIGESNGGGMAFGMALEAPDLVAAVVAGIPVPFTPKQPGTCKVKPGHEKVSIMMMASTADPILNYEKFRMEGVRDEWLGALGTARTASEEKLPDVLDDDAMDALSSYLVRYRYSPATKDGAEFLYFKMVDAGHALPNYRQLPAVVWDYVGKRNQDANFSALVWDFVSRHSKAGATGKP